VAGGLHPTRLENITGFRAEEEFGFNATPSVATGKFAKTHGLSADYR
jgi:hypothetical protein